jgi:hypothetical protein
MAKSEVWYLPLFNPSSQRSNWLTEFVRHFADIQ